MEYKHNELGLFKLRFNVYSCTNNPVGHKIVGIYSIKILHFALLKACFWMYIYRPSMKYDNALQIYALQERIQDYKNKWHDHIFKTDTESLEFPTIQTRNFREPRRWWVDTLNWNRLLKATLKKMMVIMMKFRFNIHGITKFTLLPSTSSLVYYLLSTIIQHYAVTDHIIRWWDKENYEKH